MHPAEALEKRQRLAMSFTSLAPAAFFTERERASKGCIPGAAPADFHFIMPPSQKKGLQKPAHLCYNTTW